MQPMAAVLEFQSLTKEYRMFLSRRSVRALDSFSLQVQEGEIFGFLGPNGAGKTTAIGLAMGFMRPTKGQGMLLGRPFGDPGTRGRVGFLAENVALYHREAEQLMRFYGALNGMSGSSLREKARTVLRLVGLEDQLRQNVKRLSRGMVQRVGLAQALINDPELLILDEPTSALDPLARVMVRELLLMAKKEGKTIFLSSHLLSEVELICDRVAVLNRGKLVRLGRTVDLLESGGQIEVVARGVPANEFPSSVEMNGLIRFQIPSSSQESSLRRLWELGGEIVSVNPVRRSLEDIFLELTSTDTSGASAGVQ
jgi:ABC-2 type transport system ATP-binding protein